MRYLRLRDRAVLEPVGGVAFEDEATPQAAQVIVFPVPLVVFEMHLDVRRVWILALRDHDAIGDHDPVELGEDGRCPIGVAEQPDVVAEQ